MGKRFLQQKISGLTQEITEEDNRETLYSGCLSVKIFLCHFDKSKDILGLNFPENICHSILKINVSPLKKKYFHSLTRQKHLYSIVEYEFMK